jgi:Zn-dependent protease
MPSESRSAFSLQFPVGPFPVVVDPSFWILTIFLGWSDRPEQVASWVAICFVSILVHELGHALVSRAFGATAWIRLYSFGGLCYSDRRHSKWRDIAVSVAGPGAGFCLGGLVLLANHFNPTDNPFGRYCLLQAVWVNFGWGALNLLPVLPLDGGHVLANLLGEKRQRLARWISVGVAGAAAVAALVWLHDEYVALLMGWLGLMSLSEASPAVRKRRPAATREDKNGVSLGWTALSRGDEQEAIRLGRGALHVAQDAQAASAARDLLAWATLADGNPGLALDHLRNSPAELTRPLSWALVYEALELWELALPHARAALEKEPSETSAGALLRILLGLPDREAAEKLVREYPWKAPERAQRLLTANVRAEPAA